MNRVDGLRVVTVLIITLLYSGMSHCALCCISAAPSSGWENNHIRRIVAVTKKKDRHFTYNVRLRRVPATIVAVESNEYYTLCVCVCMALII